MAGGGARRASCRARASGRGGGGRDGGSRSSGGRGGCGCGEEAKDAGSGGGRLLEEEGVARPRGHLHLQGSAGARRGEGAPPALEVGCRNDVVALAPEEEDAARAGSDPASVGVEAREREGDNGVEDGGMGVGVVSVHEAEAASGGLGEAGGGGVVAVEIPAPCGFLSTAQPV